MSEHETVAWFHCFAGIAGDMALGSLIDAGAPVAEVRQILARLPIGGWDLEVEPVLRCGIAASRAVVRAMDDGVVRTYAHIVGILEEARLPDRVRDRAGATFAALAGSEGRLHRYNAAQAHFHEVGGHDAIVDIVGTAAALEILGVDTIMSSAVATGTGMVRSSHGLLPNPAPAVVDLLSGIPAYGLDVNAELTTPTGAAILAAMASGHGPLPAMIVQVTGFGAGSRELEGLPNCTQVVIGRVPWETADEQTPTGHPALVLETNIDDATGETIAHALAALLEAGAYDAWITPVIMKKGRPGHVLSVIVDPSLVARLRQLMLDETGSLGVRSASTLRWPRSRDVDEVLVGDIPIRVKVSPGRVKAEHDDTVRAARRLGKPLHEVRFLAERAWHDKETAGDEADRRWRGRPGPFVDPSELPDSERAPAPVVGMPTRSHPDAGTDPGTDTGHRHGDGDEPSPG